VTIEAAHSKIVVRQTSVLAEKEILLKGVSERSVFHTYRYSETSIKKLKAVKEMNIKK